ncbi:hypothetical protein AAMO2058_000150700 [Amorphochlora amoebiformis]
MRYSRETAQIRDGEGENSGSATTVIKPIPRSKSLPSRKNAQRVKRLSVKTSWGTSSIRHLQSAISESNIIAELTSKIDRRASVVQRAPSSQHSSPAIQCRSLMDHKVSAKVLSSSRLNNPNETELQSILRQRNFGALVKQVGGIRLLFKKFGGWEKFVKLSGGFKMIIHGAGDFESFVRICGGARNMNNVIGIPKMAETVGFHHFIDEYLEPVLFSLPKKYFSSNSFKTSCPPHNIRAGQGRGWSPKPGEESHSMVQVNLGRPTTIVALGVAKIGTKGTIKRIDLIGGLEGVEFTSMGSYETMTGNLLAFLHNGPEKVQFIRFLVSECVPPIYLRLELFTTVGRGPPRKDRRGSATTLDLQHNIDGSNLANGCCILM